MTSSSVCSIASTGSPRRTASPRRHANSTESCWAPPTRNSCWRRPRSRHCARSQRRPKGEEEVEERYLARLGRVHCLGRDSEKRLGRPGPEPLVQPALKGYAVPLGGARRVPRPVRGHLGGEPVKATDRPPHLEQREQPDFRDKPAVGAPAVAERKNLATGAVDARRPDAEFARGLAGGPVPGR